MNTTSEKTSIDEFYMRRCLYLASQGAPYAMPNPMVGAVIVCEGRIIGEGFHHCIGEPHAEVEAFRSIRSEDRALIPNSTLYVSLEPCSHYGRTPPCAALIARKKPRRVVVGMIDPFTKVAGRGIDMVRAAGIEVCVGVLEEECKYLNRRFIVFHSLHRPYITLKWAESKDGYIDKWRTLGDGKYPARLSTPLTQMAVHHLRTLNSAILVGHNTLNLDKPSLTVRAWSGPSPRPIVLGRVGEEELPPGWLCYADIPSLIEGMKREGLQSLLVEGGQYTLQQFINQGVWDEAWIEHSEISLHEGIPAPRLPHGVERERMEKFGIPFTYVFSKQEEDFIPKNI